MTVSPSHSRVWSVIHVEGDGELAGRGTDADVETVLGGGAGAAVPPQPSGPQVLSTQSGVHGPAVVVVVGVVGAAVVVVGRRGRRGRRGHAVAVLAGLARGAGGAAPAAVGLVGGGVDAGAAAARLARPAGVTAGGAVGLGPQGDARAAAADVVAGAGRDAAVGRAGEALAVGTAAALDRLVAVVGDGAAEALAGRRLALGGAAGVPASQTWSPPAQQAVPQAVPLAQQTPASVQVKSSQQSAGLVAGAVLAAAGRLAGAVDAEAGAAVGVLHAAVASSAKPQVSVSSQQMRPVAVQSLPQAAQLVSVLAVVQTLSQQNSSFPQTMPQSPQLSGSVRTSVQSPAQQTRSPVQVSLPGPPRRRRNCSGRRRCRANEPAARAVAAGLPGRAGIAAVAVFGRAEGDALAAAAGLAVEAGAAAEAAVLRVRVEVGAVEGEGLAPLDLAARGIDAGAGVAAGGAVGRCRTGCRRTRPRPPGSRTRLAGVAGVGAAGAESSVPSWRSPVAAGAPVLQTVSQLPQLFASLSRSTQVPLQQVNPMPHSLSQAPQWSTSVSVSTHSPSQQVVVAGAGRDAGVVGAVQALVRGAIAAIDVLAAIVSDRLAGELRTGRRFRFGGAAGIGIVADLAARAAGAVAGEAAGAADAVRGARPAGAAVGGVIAGTVLAGAGRDADGVDAGADATVVVVDAALSRGAFADAVAARLAARAGKPQPPQLPSVRRRCRRTIRTARLPAPQAVPHAPQWSSSVPVPTQAPPQQVSSAPQVERRCCPRSRPGTGRRRTRRSRASRRSRVPTDPHWPGAQVVVGVQQAPP